MCNTSQAMTIMKEAVRRCGEVLPCAIENTYLYGSYARGDFTSESDVDIFMTADMSAESLSNYQRLISEINSDLSLKYDVTVSAVVKPSKQFVQYRSVLPYYQILFGKEYAMQDEESLDAVRSYVLPKLNP